MAHHPERSAGSTSAGRSGLATAPVVVLLAVALAGCASGGSGPIGATPSPPPSSAATSDRSDATAERKPSADRSAVGTPQCSGLTGDEALARWVSEMPEFSVEGSGAGEYPWDLDVADTSTYDECADLSWIRLDVEAATGGSPAGLMLFHDGIFVGPATPEHYAYGPMVQRVSDDEVTAAWSWPAPSDRPPNHTWAATSTLRWDSASEKVVRTGDLPPTTDEARAKAHAEYLATGLPSKINGILPGAGGPAPQDAAALPTLSTEDRAAIAANDHEGALAGVVAVFHTTAEAGIGCDFYDSGDVICGNSALYGSSTYGEDPDYGGPADTLHLADDGLATIINWPFGGVNNLDSIGVPVLEDGDVTRFGETVCGFANGGLTCWNASTGHGAYMNAGRISRF